MSTNVPVSARRGHGCAALAFAEAGFFLAPKAQRHTSMGPSVFSVRFESANGALSYQHGATPHEKRAHRRRGLKARTSLHEP